jgi:hypothetical protein
MGSMAKVMEAQNGCGLTPHYGLPDTKAAGYVLPQAGVEGGPLHWPLVHAMHRARCLIRRANISHIKGGEPSQNTPQWIIICCLAVT